MPVVIVGEDSWLSAPRSMSVIGAAPYAMLRRLEPSRPLRREWRKAPAASRSRTRNKTACPDRRDLDARSDERGPFELGVGRGISPYELAYCGVPFLEAQAMYEEALEVILAGLRGGPLRHRGRYYNYLDVPIELGPVQQPHPPLWQGVTNARGAADAGR